LDARGLSDAQSQSVEAIVYDGDFAHGQQIGAFYAKDVLITYLTRGKFSCTRNTAYADAVVTPAAVKWAYAKCTQVWINPDGYEVVVNFKVPATKK
jgi:hypothetical protein